MNPNIKAFLDTIAYSELGQAIIDGSDDGYNVLVGSTPKNILTFSSYADHPHVLHTIRSDLKTIVSSAAGRYQILGRMFDAYKVSLSLPDFGHESQDRIALQMMHETGADIAVINHKFDKALALASSRWASLPGAGYGQHENKRADLRFYFEHKGGESL